MINTCEICCGAKFVRLPRHKMATHKIDFSIITRLEYKEIACPECTNEQVDDNSLCVLQAETRQHFAGREISAAETDAIKAHLARFLAEELLRQNLIKFETHTIDKYYKNHTGKIGVCTPSHVITFEERIKRATLPALEEFAEKAADAISIWGRDVGRSTITKDEAVRFIRETLRKARS